MFSSISIRNIVLHATAGSSSNLQVCSWAMAASHTFTSGSLFIRVILASEVMESVILCWALHLPRWPWISTKKITESLPDQQTSVVILATDKSMGETAVCAMQSWITFVMRLPHKYSCELSSIIADVWWPAASRCTPFLSVVTSLGLSQASYIRLPVAVFHLQRCMTNCKASGHAFLKETCIWLSDFKSLAFIHPA